MRATFSRWGDPDPLGMLVCLSAKVYGVTEQASRCISFGHMNTMKLTIVEEPPTRLTEYARVPIGFAVSEVFDEQSIAALLHGALAETVAVTAPYWKDYDSYFGGHP